MLRHRERCFTSQVHKVRMDARRFLGSRTFDGFSLSGGVSPLNGTSRLGSRAPDSHCVSEVQFSSTTDGRRRPSQGAQAAAKAADSSIESLHVLPQCVSHEGRHGPRGASGGGGSRFRCPSRSRSDLAQAPERNSGQGKRLDGRETLRFEEVARYRAASSCNGLLKGGPWHSNCLDPRATRSSESTGLSIQSFGDLGTWGVSSCQGRRTCAEIPGPSGSH